MNHERKRDLALEKAQGVLEDDFSASEKHLLQRDLSAEQIANLKQYRALRHYAFFGVAILSAVGFMTLLAWTASFGYQLFYGSNKGDLSKTGLVLTPIAVMAALVIAPVLAMIRFVFRQTGEQSEDSDTLSVWQTIIKELSDVLKTYVSRAKPAA